uniref:Regulator of telomere elongation helicase 1 n=1 Tax=Acanthochromis polyacanthus TaxID=80966 RepID=A0A3Q1FMP8_9TELE
RELGEKKIQVSVIPRSRDICILKPKNSRPKVCVLGSREQLCINPDVMRQESNHVKVHMCRAKVSTRSCLYYNNVEEKSTDKDLTTSILDVEDLVKYGNKQRVCPYYLSRSLKQQADIIFMPYNYLLDPKSRRAHNIELNGAVVIFDEAHNVEKTCEESTSFDLTPYDVTSAINAVDKLLLEQVKEASHGDSATEDFNVESLSSGHCPCVPVTEILLDLEAAIDSYDPSDKGITKPGIFIYELLQKAHVTFSTKTVVCDHQLSPVCLHQVHIHRDTSYHTKKQSSDVWAPSSSKKQGNILSYWCFSPGFSMQDLVNQGVRCIILTSGTLSPLSSFTSEMRIDTHYFTCPIKHQAYELLTIMSNLSRVVPHVSPENLDVFANGHADRIENVKPMFVEPKGKGTFTEVIDGYYSKVNCSSSKGASFFAVCRGKASEGLDFANTFGRGVIITGLPFPPKLDPRVILKMQFLDEMSWKKLPGLKYLSGQEWYRQQAFRAVNQAIGRVIRHKEDYGAIFLCDQRSWSCLSHYFTIHDTIAFLCFGMTSYAELTGTLFKMYPTGHPVLSFTDWLPAASSYSDEHRGANGMARICLEYESDVQENQRRPANLLDALERGDHRSVKDADSLMGEEKASHLSTLSLQHDKRMDDELRGGKRKIKLVQEQVLIHSLLLCFVGWSYVHFRHLYASGLQTYKTTDDLDALLTETAVLTEYSSTHSLLRGVYQFIRPHHKKRFDEKCKELTGQGCGYRPDHSLTKDERKAVMAKSVASSSTCTQLNTQQLNQGGHHLTQQGLREPQAGERFHPFTCHAQYSLTIL